MFFAHRWSCGATLPHPGGRKTPSQLVPRTSWFIPRRRGWSKRRRESSEGRRGSPQRRRGSSKSRRGSSVRRRESSKCRRGSSERRRGPSKRRIRPITGQFIGRKAVSAGGALISLPAPAAARRKSVSRNAPSTWRALRPARLPSPACCLRAGSPVSRRSATRRSPFP